MFLFQFSVMSSRLASLSRVLLAAALTSLAAFAPTQAAVPPTELTVLENIYNSTGGATWARNDNWMNGGDPCDQSAPWFGIRCNSAGQISEIILSSDPPYRYTNSLSGPFPDIRSLTALEVIDVSWNSLTGTIPSLRNLTALRVFKVDANKITGHL